MGWSYVGWVAGWVGGGLNCMYVWDREHMLGMMFRYLVGSAMVMCRDHIVDKTTRHFSY